MIKPAKYMIGHFDVPSGVPGLTLCVQNYLGYCFASISIVGKLIVHASAEQDQCSVNTDPEGAYRLKIDNTAITLRDKATACELAKLLKIRLQDPEAQQ